MIDFPDKPARGRARARPRFPMGRLFVTPGAREAVGSRALTLLARHQLGDWGDVCAEDAAANERALRDEARLLSAYRLPTGARVWIITEADRSATSILTPEEY